jgi:hypothetical protein
MDTPFIASFLFYLPNSFEKNPLCIVMQVEHTLHSKYHPPTHGQLDNNLTLSIE